MVLIQHRILGLLCKQTKKIHIRIFFYLLLGILIVLVHGIVIEFFNIDIIIESLNIEIVIEYINTEVIFENLN